MLDLAVAGGTLVVPEQGLVRADVGILGEQVVAIAAPGTLPDAARVLDATGRHVFPGLVDPHAHFGNFTPLANETAHETRAAALGGVTTVGLFLRETASYHTTVPEARAAVEPAAAIDFFFHAVIQTEQQLAELPEYAARWGITSFKAYMAGMPGIFEGVDDGFLLALFQQAAALGEDVLVCVHAENAGLCYRASRQVAARLGAAPGTLADWSAARPDTAEAEAIARAAYLAQLAGARLYVVHLTSARGAEQVRQLKAGGAALYAETVTHYLSLTVDHPLGTLLKRVPPLRTGMDAAALWQAVADGTVDTLGTDNVVISRALKGDDPGIFVTKGGFTVLGTHLPVLLDEGYHRRGVDLRRLVSALTERPAHLFGLYPRKGTIAVGTDADLVVVDLDRAQRVDVRRLGSWSDFSPWDGQLLRGWPLATVLRGRVIAQGGELVGAPQGRYLPRGQAAQRPAAP